MLRNVEFRLAGDLEQQRGLGQPGDADQVAAFVVAQLAGQR